MWIDMIAIQVPQTHIHTAWDVIADLRLACAYTGRLFNTV